MSFHNIARHPVGRAFRLPFTIRYQERLAVKLGVISKDEMLAREIFLVVLFLNTQQFDNINT
jgi:hypothetical protein